MPPSPDELLEVALDQAWQRGWTPADVAHVVSRMLTAAHRDEVAVHLVADGRRRLRRGQRLHPRWQRELDVLGDHQPATPSPAPDERLRLAIEVARLVARLPDQPVTIPPPGDLRAAAATTRHLDARMLDRVRALLAKAESTTFEDEAAALTAKAQELITRHAIDEALLHAEDDGGEPSVRRIPVADPYADAKAHLFGEVARANRCKVVFSKPLGWVTAFGYDQDLDALELLTTSLLAQATGAMARQGPRRDASGRSRTRSFRRAFLLGFAQRIGERLQQAADEQLTATGDEDARLLPVLAARDERMTAAMLAAFPDLQQREQQVSNATGLLAGRSAADRASIAVPGGRLTAG